MGVVALQIGKERRKQLDEPISKITCCGSSKHSFRLR